MFGDLPRFLWGEAVNTIIYILNRCPTKLVEGKTPYEAWTGKKPNIFHFRIFGCDSYAFFVPTKRKKLDKRSEKCIFMGYENQQKGYKLYQPSSRVVFVSRDVKFNKIFEDSTSCENLDECDNSSIAPNWMDVNVDMSPKE